MLWATVLVARAARAAETDNNGGFILNNYASGIGGDEAVRKD